MISGKDKTPQLTVIIPAWNESEYLPATLQTIQSAQALAGIELEIIVVDNQSTDDTKAIAIAHHCRVVEEPEHKIARVRNTGAQSATSNHLLFVDADTQVNAEHLSAVCKALQTDHAGGGAPIRFDSELTHLQKTGLWAWNKLAQKLNLAAGCFVFVRADLHHQIGGFDERVYAGEEIHYSRKLSQAARQAHLAFNQLPVTPVISSARKLRWFPIWQHVLVFTTFVLFPWAGRFKRLSWFWYTRPRG